MTVDIAPAVLGGRWLLITSMLLMQNELASVAESVADRLHASEESRNLLIEQTREFKKNSSEVNKSTVMQSKTVQVSVSNSVIIYLLKSERQLTSCSFTSTCGRPAVTDREVTDVLWHI